MKPPSDRDAQLERWVQRTLQDLPARPAPRSLEARVLAEIAQRAAQPWWRKSFVHWPVAARAVFLLAMVAVVKAVLMAAVWSLAGFDTAEFRAATAQPSLWIEHSIAIFNAATGFVEIMLRNIPPLWIYGTLAFLAAMYAALFGLGAAAYRMIQDQR
jgi:hypothetical protein